MKGIILAGGHGTRLHPLTLAISKQLLPVYDKPMIYYPLSTLIECGIREIAVIVKSADYYAFERLLGTGIQWGVEIEYYFQNHPKGIADAFLVCEKFIGKDSVCLILGDNIFVGGVFEIMKAVEEFNGGATIFGYESASPERYGVVGFGADGKVLSIEEKPKVPKSAYAVTGCYLYDNYVIDIAKCVKLSARGELEITDVNNAYITRGGIGYVQLPKTCRWLDAGTSEDLHWASTCVRNSQQEWQRRIGCPTEAAKRRDAHVIPKA